MARKNTTNNVANNEAELIKGVTYDPEPLEVDEAEIEELLSSKFYDPKKTEIDLEGLAALSKDVKKSAAFIDDEQLRIIIDSYYQAQHNRITTQNQIRAVEQGYDEAENLPAMMWLLANYDNTENQIKKMIEAYTDAVPVCKWAKSIKGIGPMFAAILWDAINIEECNHANQFLTYAGLNDNNIPWLGKEKAEQYVNDAYECCGLKKTDPINDNVIIYLCAKTGRKFASILKGFESHKEKTPGSSDRVILIKYLSKPPYNKDLKSTCFLIGEAFCKVSNRGSLYGRLYRERRAWELQRNEEGAYREQAERLLKEKNYDKSTPTYKCLIQGKLSPGHINQRAKRWATKIFLTHFFEACYIYKHGAGSKPPVIYPIAFMGHTDYIEPEVPYSDYI